MRPLSKPSRIVLRVLHSLACCILYVGCSASTEVNPRPPFDPTAQPYIFAGTSEGLYRSEDHGQTWQRVDSIGGSYYTAIVANSEYVFAASHGGVSRSSDGGINWVQCNSGLQDISINGLAASETELYVVPSGGGIFRSTNNGDSWREVYSGASFQLIALHNSIAMVPGLRSTDHGRTWNFHEGVTGLDQTIAGTEQYFFIGGRGLIRSADNGASWQSLHTDEVYDIVSRDSMMLFAGDQGVFRSTDFGVTWEQMPNLLIGVNHFGPLLINGKYIFVDWRRTNDGVYWEALGSTQGSGYLVSFGPK